MIARIFKVAIVAVLLSLSSGCIEGVAIVTLNPDGRGKLEVDLYVQGDELFGGDIGGKKDKEPTLAEKKTSALIRTLTGSPGVAAWKDVKAEWAADGRFHFVGTAYFDRIENLKDKLLVGEYRFSRDNDGVISFVGTRKESGEKKTFPNLADLNEKQLSDFILSERIKYQSAKPIIIAMLTDLKFKTTFRLPGDAVDIKGFKKTSERVVVQDTDGNALLGEYKKIMAQDDAAFKKLYREAKSLDLDETLAAKFDMKPALTIRKAGDDQFDYAKEVKAAIEAYPNLRKQNGLADTVPLPGDGKAVPPKFPGR